MAEDNKSSLDALSALCKRRGFIYHSSEIYGGMPGFWDYGPLGCELKNNVKQAWWQFTVRGREERAAPYRTAILRNTCTFPFAFSPYPLCFALFPRFQRRRDWVTDLKLHKISI